MPEKIGHYTIVSQLGRGGMGIVYKAHDESLNRFVAIKVLTEQLNEDDTFLQRFLREAQAAAGLSHPNIVQIFFIGEDQGHPYFVMEFVSGRSLNRIVHDEGRIGNPKASQLILQAAHGLAAAHDQGIIHRDIKPANLILDDRGMVKIADFGLALRGDAEARLTATGMLVGTPGYLAPEQCRGEKVDQRTDIYALGVTFYEILAGCPPFRGESPLALLRQILDEEPPDISSLNPDVDEDTRRILDRMIAKDRTQRYQDCHEIVADLEDYLAKHGIRSMTAGLATRTPSTTPELAAAAAAMAATAQASTQRGVKMTSPTSSQDIATEIVPSVEPQPVAAAGIVAGAGAMAAMPSASQTRGANVTPPPSGAFAGPPTLPETPIPGRDTDVPRGATVPSTPPPAAVVPTPPPASRSSMSTVLVIALALILLVGGGIAAVFVAMKMIHSRQTAKTPAAVSKPVQQQPDIAAAGTKTGPNPADQGILLSQEKNFASLGGAGGTAPAGSSVQVTPRHDGAGQPGTGAASQSSHGTAVRSTDQPSARGDEVTAAHEHSARALSGVGVAVTGDPGLLGSVSNVLTSELEAAGLKVVDAATLPSTENLVRGGEVPAARLIDRLRGEGLAVLLLARVDPAGQRELKYLGRYDTAFSARITVTTYDLATGRPFGPHSSATIEYTAATADRESEKVVGRLARSVAEAIQKR